MCKKNIVESINMLCIALEEMLRVKLLLLHRSRFVQIFKIVFKFCPSTKGFTVYVHLSV